MSTAEKMRTDQQPAALPEHPLTQWREQHELTQAQLAEKLDVTTGYICRIERWNLISVHPKFAARLEAETGIPRLSFLYPAHHLPSSK